MNYSIQNLFSVEGKTAIVTGGSSGIGLMIASAFVANGMKVYITSRKKEVCDAVAAELSKHGVCISIPADLSTDEGRKHFVEKFKQAEQSLHVLVNNAGAVWAAAFEDYPEKGYDKVMDINVKAPFMLTRDLAGLLKKASLPGDPARVINVGSIDGIKVPFLENYAYGPSKAAVHYLTKVLAVRLGKDGITVNAIAPGPFESRMTEKVMEFYKSGIEKMCPLNRIGEPGDMAGVAIYLSSKAGSYVNGVVIPVDGGIHLS